MGCCVISCLEWSGFSIRSIMAPPLICLVKGGLASTYEVVGVAEIRRLGEYWEFARLVQTALDCLECTLLYAGISAQCLGLMLQDGERILMPSSLSWVKYPWGTVRSRLRLVRDDVLWEGESVHCREGQCIHVTCGTSFETAWRVMGGVISCCSWESFECFMNFVGNQLGPKGCWLVYCIVRVVVESFAVVVVGCSGNGNVGDWLGSTEDGQSSKRGGGETSSIVCPWSPAIIRCIKRREGRMWRSLAGWSTLVESIGPSQRLSDNMSEAMYNSEMRAIAAELADLTSLLEWGSDLLRVVLSIVSVSYPVLSARSCSFNSNKAVMIANRSLLSEFQSLCWVLHLRVNRRSPRLSWKQYRGRSLHQMLQTCCSQNAVLGELLFWKIWALEEVCHWVRETAELGWLRSLSGDNDEAELFDLTGFVIHGHSNVWQDQFWVGRWLWQSKAYEWTKGYENGFEVPRNVSCAKELNEQNGQKPWKNNIFG